MEMLKRDKNMANKTDGIYNMNYSVQCIDNCMVKV